MTVTAENNAADLVNGQVVGTVERDWSVALVARQTAGTKLQRRQWRVTSVRPLYADWLNKLAAPVLNYKQKDSIHKLKTKDLQLKCLDERRKEPKQGTVILRRKSV